MTRAGEKSLSLNPPLLLSIWLKPSNLLQIKEKGNSSLFCPFPSHESSYTDKRVTKPEGSRSKPKTCGFRFSKSKKQLQQIRAKELRRPSWLALSKGLPAANAYGAQTACSPPGPHCHLPRQAAHSPWRATEAGSGIQTGLVLRLKTLETSFLFDLFKSSLLFVSNYMCICWGLGMCIWT